MTKDKKNKIVLIIVLASVLVLTLASSAIFSVVQGPTPDFVYSVSAQLDRANLLATGQKTFDVITPPVKSGDFSFKVTKITPEEACITFSTEICFKDQEQKIVAKHIDVKYTTLGLTQEDDTDFVGNFEFYIDADTALTINYEDRTGLQLKENFVANYDVTTDFEKKMNIGILSESRSLLLEEASTSQVTQPTPLQPQTKQAYSSPIDTSQLGLNEVRVRPYIRFSREDRHWDVSTKKVLIVNYRVSPLIEGTTINDLPQGSIGLIDIDSPVQRAFVTIQEDTSELVQEPENNPSKLLGILAIIAVLIVVVMSLLKKGK